MPKFTIWFVRGNENVYEEFECDNEYEADDYAWDRFLEEAEQDHYCGVIDLGYKKI